MKFPDYRQAYQLQKKLTAAKKIAAYKVGGSNKRSQQLFNMNNLILGGIERQQIFFGEIKQDYPTVEAEIISQIRLDPLLNGGFEVIQHFIGLECPNIVGQHPESDAFKCIEKNCAAGALIVYEPLTQKNISSFLVEVNGNQQFEGSIDNLIFSVEDILYQTVGLINKHKLHYDSDEILIATGGVTDVFSLSSGSQIRFNYE